MIDPSMGDVIESPYMMKTLRSTPMSSAAPISLRMSVRATFSDFSQASGMQRQQRRCDQRARYHGHRVDVLGQYDVVEGIVHRPKDVAHQQGDVGLEFAHPACRFPPPETKTMPAEYLPVRTRKPESRFRLSCFRSGSSLELLRRAAPRAAARPRRSTHSASRCRPCGGSGPARGRCAAKDRGRG